MNKLTYYQQLFLGSIVVLASVILGTVVHLGILVNIAWVIFGALFAIHPVAPRGAKNKEQFKQFIRVGGVLIIFMGITMNPGL